jgi:uncharacterized membrane protein
MSHHAAITVNRPREEVERLWADTGPHLDGSVAFAKAPGDRGTEIHVELERSGLRKLVGGPALAKAKDELRRFKQRVETGEVPRSDATPEGELAERKLDQRPAQPAGVS